MLESGDKSEIWLNTKIERFVTFGLPDIPEVTEGTNLGDLISIEMAKWGGIKEGDIFVVASKIVSKSEGRIVDLETIEVSDVAQELSRKSGKPADICQLMINESKSIKYREAGFIQAVNRNGFLITSAGVDRYDKTHATVLPEDPDLSARQIMSQIFQNTQHKCAIIISDSEGRDGRRGAVAVSLGVAGIQPLRVTDTIDPLGNPKKLVETLCDMLASQAAIIMGQRGKGIPIVCVRGLKYEFSPDASIKPVLEII